MQPTKSLKVAIIAMAALILITAAPSAQAQSLSGGAKVGLNVADMYGDQVGSTDVRALFSGGLFLTYRANDIFAIQPELNFTMKGADVAGGALGEGQLTTYEFGYLEIPLLFKAYVPAPFRAMPNLYAGPSIGIKLFGEADGTDLDDQVNPTEASLIFGGGLEVPFGRRALIFDLRYAVGMTDVFDVAGDPEARTGTLSASVGLRF